MAKNKFGALAEFRQTQGSPVEHEESVASAPVSSPLIQQQIEPPRPKARPLGKRSNPDYEPTTVLLRKQTKKKASRLLEDTESEHDLSDLIEKLLTEWITEHT